MGKLRENHGMAVVASGQTIPHGAGTTPETCWVQPNVDYPVAYSRQYDGTNITVTHDGLGAISFHWKVEYE